MALWVKYIGRSGTRVITAHDWKRADLEGEKPISWSRMNGWTADISELSDKAQGLILVEPEMVEVSGAVAEMEKDAARRMPRDQRKRTPVERTRTEELKQELTTTAQTDVDSKPVVEGKKAGAK